MKKVSILSVIIFAGCFILFAVCTESKAQSVAKVRKAIEESNQDYIRWFNNNHVDSLLSLYRDDACLLGQGCGKSAIRDYFESQMNTYTFKALQILSLSVGDSIAVEKGRWIMVFSTGDELEGVYMTEWRLTNKKWLIVNDIGTSK